MKLKSKRLYLIFVFYQLSANTMNQNSCSSYIVITRRFYARLTADKLFVKFLIKRESKIVFLPSLRSDKVEMRRKKLCLDISRRNLRQPLIFNFSFSSIFFGWFLLLVFKTFLFSPESNSGAALFDRYKLRWSRSSKLT